MTYLVTYRNEKGLMVSEWVMFWEAVQGIAEKFGVSCVGDSEKNDLTEKLIKEQIKALPF